MVAETGWRARQQELFDPDDRDMSRFDILPRFVKRLPGFRAEYGSVLAAWVEAAGAGRESHAARAWVLQRAGVKVTMFRWAMAWLEQNDVIEVSRAQGHPTRRAVFLLFRRSDGQIRRLPRTRPRLYKGKPEGCSSARPARDSARPARDSARPARDSARASTSLLPVAQAIPGAGLRALLDPEREERNPVPSSGETPPAGAREAGAEPEPETGRDGGFQGEGEGSGAEPETVVATLGEPPPPLLEPENPPRTPQDGFQVAERPIPALPAPERQGAPVLAEESALAGPAPTSPTAAPPSGPAPPASEFGPGRGREPEPEPEPEPEYVPPTEEELLRLQREARGSNGAAMLARVALSAHRRWQEERARPPESKDARASPPEPALAPVPASVYAPFATKGRREENGEVAYTPRRHTPPPEYPPDLVVAKVRAAHAADAGPWHADAAAEAWSRYLRDDQPATREMLRDAVLGLGVEYLERIVREALAPKIRSPAKWTSSRLANQLKLNRLRRAAQRNASPGLVLPATPARRPESVPTC